MKGFIKYFVHDDSCYITPHYAQLANINAMLKELCTNAAESLNLFPTAAHSVYAIKRYDENGDLSQVDFYTPPVCLDDDEFYKRTDAVYAEDPNCVILAIHRKP